MLTTHRKIGKIFDSYETIQMFVMYALFTAMSLVTSISTMLVSVTFPGAGDTVPIATMELVSVTIDVCEIDNIDIYIYIIA